MDYQTIINIGAGAILAAVGWFVRIMWEANKELRDDLAKLKDHMADKYMRRDDFREFAREIRELLLSISDKLDKKADK